MTRLLVAIGLAMVVTAARWTSGRVRWWTDDEQLAIGALLPAERDLVRRADVLLSSAP